MHATASPTLHHTRHLLAYAVLTLGLQTIQATNSTFLAPLLESLGSDPFWISVILSLDPITCIVALPLLNRWSDRTTSRWGSRLPFILVGVMLAAAALTWIGAATTPAQIAAGMVVLYVGTSAVWGPYRATLGEMIAPSLHTATTGLQGLFQGIGTLVAMGVGGLLLAYGPGWPYRVAAGVLLACSVVSIAVMHRAVATAPPRSRPATDFASFFRGARDLHWLLAAQTCWWAAMSGIVAFAVLFVTHEILGIARIGEAGSHAGTQQAVGILLLFAVVSMLTAVPCGRLAERYGKVRVLRWGLLVWLVGTVMALVTSDLTTLRVAIVLSGMGFAAVQVIPVALFAELQPPGHEGSVMSLLGVFTDGPLMIGYLLEGWLIARTGSYRIPFLLATVLILAAWWCIGHLRTTGQRVAVREV